ncbi:MAG: outer membrane receptor for ferrienterochelin and colicins, partial [Sphingobacteriales bacterium]
AGNTSISLDAARHYFDGIDFNDSTRSLDWNRKEQYFISPSLIFNPNKSLQIGAFTNYTSEKITAFGDVRTNGRSAFDNYFDTKRVDNRLFLNQKVSSASSINAQLAYNTFVRTKKEVNFNLLSTETTLTAPSNQDTQLSTRYYGKLMYNTKFRTINSDFVLGVEEDFEMGDGTRLNDSTTNQISNFSVFSGIKKSFQNGLAVQPGVRLISNSLYGFQIAPAINVRYVNNHYTYRFSFAEGVRNPSINELYFRFVDVNHDVLGNPNLEPETSQYYSFSVKHKKVLNKTIIKTDFSLFTNQSKKLIQLVSTNPNSLEFTYLNLNSYDVYGNSLGVEVKQNKLEFYVSNSLLLKENFGNTNTKAFILSSNLQSLVSYTIPVIKIKSTVSYRLFINPTKLSIDLTGETSQQVLANFQFLDLNFTKSFSKDQFRLGFGVKNLVNTTSADVTSGSVNSIHGAQAQQSLSYGRTFHISLKYQLTKNDNE